MSRPSDGDPSARAPRESFQTTRWGVVLAARGRSGPEARQALEDLCSTYWYPLYAFVRRKGYDADSALDLVQGFFARLLEKDDLRDVDPARGRFRSFLMASCSHYLANRADHDRALKRGGNVSTFSIHPDEAENRYAREPSHDLTPERLYLRRWATIVLDLVLKRLQVEMAEAGKADLFEALKPALLGDEGAAPYRELGALVGLSQGAARLASHRLRARYRAILREEIGRTLADPADVDQEVRDLFVALSG